MKAKDIKQTNIIEDISDVSEINLKQLEQNQTVGHETHLSKSNIYNKSPQGNFDDSIFKSNIDHLNNN